jgi:hypothetical protein
VSKYTLSIEIDVGWKVQHVSALADIVLNGDSSELFLAQAELAFGDFVSMFRDFISVAELDQKYQAAALMQMIRDCELLLQQMKEKAGELKTHA